MTPAFQLLADNEDVTATIADRLISLEVTDEDGIKADRLTLELDLRDRVIAIPSAETRLDLSLGFREAGLTKIGAYVLEERNGSGPPDVMTLVARAADMSSAIRAPKTRGWTAITLGGIVRTIAAEAGLTPVVGEDIGDTVYGFVAQSAESDLHLLTRLARVLDATAKPADGRLIVTRRGTGRAADGSQIEPVAIPRARMQSYGWQFGKRGTYASVTAKWADLESAATKSVEAGSGEPGRRLRETFGSELEAQRAAQAELDRAARGEVSVDLELSGFWPQLFASGRIALPDLLPELSESPFHVTSVSHRLQGSLTTRVSAELAAPREDS